MNIQDSLVHLATRLQRFADKAECLEGLVDSLREAKESLDEIRDTIGSLIDDIECVEFDIDEFKDIFEEE